MHPVGKLQADCINLRNIKKAWIFPLLDLVLFLRILGHFLKGAESMTESRYFRDYPAKTGERALFKMEHYLEIYDELLCNWHGRDVSFLEIGVYKGGSIPMWQGFFAPTSRLTFLDIDPACMALQLPGTQVRIGDQTDAAFLQEVGGAQGPFDLIVDVAATRWTSRSPAFAISGRS
jgi:hypothetical protein